MIVPTRYFWRPSLVGFPDALPVPPGLSSLLGFETGTICLETRRELGRLGSRGVVQAYLTWTRAAGWKGVASHTWHTKKQRLRHVVLLDRKFSSHLSAIRACERAMDKARGIK